MRTPDRNRLLKTGRQIVPTAMLFGLGLFINAVPVVAAQWTVGIYMAADNGLNDQSYQDLAEMMAVGSTPEVNIVVQVDNSARDSNPGCRRLYIRKDGYDKLEDLGPVNMADTAALAGFARFLARDYPARNYFVILWDHGDGWYEGYRTEAIFIDESHSAMMGVAGGELGAALRAMRRELGRRIRVLAFDACLMGMIEVAMEARANADYMLASEALVPWGGFPYDEILGLLVAQPRAEPAEFLPRMCTAYVESYAGRDVSLAATDLRRLDELLPVLRRRLAEIDPADPELAESRARVQTYPRTTGIRPHATDSHIDFIGLWEQAPEAAGPELLEALRRLVVARAAEGRVAGARGLAGWFPASWLRFKRLKESYLKLTWADSVPWPQFLNAWYGQDDVRPTRPEIIGHHIGRRGDIRLWWRPGQDLAPVNYDLYEADSLADRLVDDCASLDNWSAIGWNVDRTRFRSPPGAFGSGTGTDIDHQLVLVEPLQLAAGGLLSFFAWYDTRESEEPDGSIRRNPGVVEWCEGPPWNWQVIDSFYGSAPRWHERRYLLPRSSRLYLRFRYLTEGPDRWPGVFIDDIRVSAFGQSRQIAEGLADTSFSLFNLPHNRYSYVVTAADSWGNVSMASQLYPVAIERLAEPVTRPAPFSDNCQLWFDTPPGSTASIRIYTISGALVNEFQNVTGPYIEWNGRNAHGRKLADGLYLVVVSGEGFRTVGRIAKVARTER